MLKRDNEQVIPIFSSKQDLKRKRVTRACDICRQKKVKCDGKQPCIHCTVYSYKCTYDQPNIRNKKNSGIPIPSQASPAILKVAAAAAAAVGNGSSPTSLSSINITNNLITCQNILNILVPKLKLNCLDETNPIEIDLDKFQKAVNSSKHLSDVADSYLDNNFEYKHSRNPSISSNDESTSSISDIKLILPEKKMALQLIFTTWNKACVLFRFYHRPSLLEEVDLLYSLDTSSYGDRQQKFLPFLYSVLACGSIFCKSSKASPGVNENLEDDGFKYFLEARKLIDITNVGDINSIQTIVMMIMYLQCSARLSTCYSYIGIALRSALKEGLHRNLSIFQSKRKLDPIEVDTRKRLFYTIYKMDIYINSLLGLPGSINEDEIDQDFPEDLDDENITRDDYLYDQQEGRLSSSGCANHHTKLMLIISHIIKQLYPIKVKNSDATPLTPDHIHSKVTNLELELKTWLDGLPVELKPNDPNSLTPRDVPEKYVMANHYIHLAFLNCQIMLYRPFIHYISNGSSFMQTSDPRSLIRGRNCIKVARMVVKLANKMIDQDLLVGTYWFSMYTIFFSIACLIYYYHFANYNNSASGVNYAGVLFDDDLNIDMIKNDIEIGKKVLDNLKNNSNASLRIFNILNNLFEQLNRRTADSSRMRLEQGELYDEDVKAAHNTNFLSETIQSTFKNFDKMNSFSQDKTSTSTESTPSNQYSAYPLQNSKKFDELSAIRASAIHPTLSISTMDEKVKPKNEENNEVNNPLYSSQGAVQKQPPEPISNPVPIPALPQAPVLSEDSSLKSEQVEYVPGVFDRLDAQIFGRILPPYMLQQNARLANKLEEATSQGTPEPQVRHSSTSSIYNSQLQDINLDFDFSQLGDPNSLEYLDPFNPVNLNSQFNYDPPKH